MNRFLLAFALAAGAGFAQEPADALSHTKWTLNSERGKATLTFESGHFAVKGCNTIGGSYRVDGGRIVVSGPLRSTQMACPGGQKIDAALSALLAKNQSFRVEGNQLTLTGTDGVPWVFSKTPMASANAVTKFIYVASVTKDCAGGAGRMKCLQIRETPEQPWRLHAGVIVGFEPVPGIEYRLRIKEDRLAKPAADQSSIVWYLDMVVQQKVVDRAAAEAYEKAKQ